MALLNRLLALGTVQFGLPYGVANNSGQVSRDEACAILEHAWTAGLDTLDTAIAYGDSEKRLGEIGVGQWQVISKLPAIPEGCTNVADWARELVIGSLERLKINRLRGVLLHRPHQLLGPQGRNLFRALTAIRDQGLVEKIGVSIYGPEELDALSPYFHFDLVQAPFNVIDRRLDTSGWLTRLHQAATEVHIRSIFLQGVLLMESEMRPPIFKRWHSLWLQWDRWLNEQALTPLQACLGLARLQPGVDRVVIGVDSLRQLQQIFASFATSSLIPPSNLISEDLDLINPSRWSTL